MNPPATISATRLMELLTPTLGWDKSSEVVSVALARRGQTHGELPLDDALALLEGLSRTAGMVGIAARYAATRLQAMRPAAADPPPRNPDTSRGAPPSLPGAPPSSGTPAPAATSARLPAAPPPSSGVAPSSQPSPPSSTLRSAEVGAPPTSGAGDVPSSSRGRPAAVDLRDIVELFEGAMGRERSEEVLFATARRLGLPPERLDRAHALALVDSLVNEPGILGLCARFAKARLILRFAA